MKLYSWLRALLIFMVMSAVLTNIIPPRYEGSYKVVMRLIFLMILLKPVLLLLFNEEYITDRVNTLYNDYSKNIAGYSSSYTGDSSLQSDYYSYVSNAVKQTVISRVLNIAEECKVEVNNVKVELNDKSILNKSDTDYSSVITGIDISVKNKKSVSSLESTQNAKTALNKSDIEYCVIGNGSNLLVSDKGIRGVVIQLSDTFDEVEYIDDVTVKVMSGMMLSRLGNKLADKGLAGFEFATGIPGSVGGAVRMNAGAYGGEIKDIIVSADVLDRSGRLISLSRDELELGYRTSCIAAMDYIVVSAVFRLQKGDTDTIKALIKELAVKRRAKQPLEYPSAGSTFKRPQGFFAAKLIEDAGLKGVSVGGAMVSEKHSGFVVNAGNATAKDVCMLTDMVKDKVKQQSGVDLELEVIKLGDFS